MTQIATPYTPGRVRMRRTRGSPLLRDLVAETGLRVDKLVMPHFVVAQNNAREPIAALPGVSRFGVDDLVREVERDRTLGIRAILLFGLAADGTKNAIGSNAWNEASAVARAIRALRSALGRDILVA
ncbi:MAG: hypothetical protein AB1762_09850, partial [Gemmatimonadota bacterium]